MYVLKTGHASNISASASTHRQASSHASVIAFFLRTIQPKPNTPPLTSYIPHSAYFRFQIRHTPLSTLYMYSPSSSFLTQQSAIRSPHSTHYPPHSHSKLHTPHHSFVLTQTGVFFVSHLSSQRQYVNNMFCNGHLDT